MSELISCKNAYNLIGQGIEVQAHVEYEKGLFEWQDAKELPACDILNGRFDFRLKTIMINGIEVPEPFEPEEGEKFYYATASTICGWSYEYAYDQNKHMRIYGAWRTEAEVKQVIAALREVFNPLN